MGLRVWNSWAEPDPPPAASTWNFLFLQLKHKSSTKSKGLPLRENIQEWLSSPAGRCSPETDLVSAGMSDFDNM